VSAWQRSVAGRSMDAMNTDWHEEHPLGSNASMDERVRWHLQHQAKCGCRPVPKDVQDVIDAHAHASS
jgi:hypothetical protein